MSKRLAKSSKTFVTSKVKKVVAQPKKQATRKVSQNPTPRMGKNLTSRIGNSSAPVGRRTSRGVHPHDKPFRTSDSLFVETLTVPISPVTGMIIWSRRNRASIPNTLLEVDAGRFTKWRPIKYSYRFIPATGSNYSAMLIGATDPDPLSVYNTNSTNIQRMSVLEGHHLQQEWKGINFHHPGNREVLWVNDLDSALDNSDDRFSSAGNSMIAIVTKGDMVAGQELGVIMLDYDIEFSEARLSPVMESSTSIVKFIMSSFITDVNASVAAKSSFSILDWVFKKIVDISPSLSPTALPPLAAILALSYNFVKWIDFDYLPQDDLITSFNRRLKCTNLTASPTESVGIDPGSIDYKIYIASINELDDTTTPSSQYGPFLKSPSVIYWPSTATDVHNTVPPENRVTNVRGMYDPATGTVHPFGQVIHGRFRTDATRAIADTALLLNTESYTFNTTNFPAIWMEFQTKAARKVFTFSPSVVEIPDVKGTSLELKSVKVVTSPPITSVPLRESKEPIGRDSSSISFDMDSPELTTRSITPALGAVRFSLPVVPVKSTPDRR